MASTMRSIQGRGKLSFGQALLMSVKSMQSRHLSFAFLTRTTLANHSGYSPYLITFAWRSLPTSSLIVFYLSGAKLLLFCLTSLKEGLTFNLWVITVGSTPPSFKENTSMVCSRKRMRELLMSSANLDPMKMRCYGWSPSCTGSNSSEGVGRVVTSSRMSSSSM